MIDMNLPLILDSAAAWRALGQFGGQTNWCRLETIQFVSRFYLIEWTDPPPPGGEEIFYDFYLHLQGQLHNCTTVNIGYNDNVIEFSSSNVKCFYAFSVQRALEECYGN